jgi:hypothetical protein
MFFQIKRTYNTKTNFWYKFLAPCNTWDSTGFIINNLKLSLNNSLKFMRFYWYHNLRCTSYQCYFKSYIMKRRIILFKTHQKLMNSVLPGFNMLKLQDRHQPICIFLRHFTTPCADLASGNFVLHKFIRYSYNG